MTDKADFYDEYAKKHLRDGRTTMGAHYKVPGGEEHHERVKRLGLNWYASNITKYAERAERKGQLKADLWKIIEYTELWLKSVPHDDGSEPTKNYVDQG